MGAVRLVAWLVVAAESSASTKFVELLACSDADCGDDCRVVSSHALDQCELGSPLSTREGVKAEFNASSGELVFNYWDNANATCDGRFNSQNGYLKPFSCQQAATGVFSTYRLAEAGACSPNCTQCGALWSLKMCSWVPTTIPPTNFEFAADACVACVAGLRDDSGCGCAGCWPSAARGDADTTALRDACARSMCDERLQMPCEDCGEVAPSAAACEACVRREVAAPSLAGLCNFTLAPGGACDVSTACG